jgi:hypothetical protein
VVDVEQWAQLRREHFVAGETVVDDYLREVRTLFARPARRDPR